MRTYRAEDVAPIYGLSAQDFLPNAPIQTVSTGSPVLMLPLVSHEALKRARCVDFDAYRKLRAAGDFLFAHHFVVQGATERGTTFARSLGTTPTSHEDPFTGSATGCMAAYLWKHGLISSPRFIAEQGHWMGRPGEAEVEVVGEPDAIQTIRVAGQAVKIIEGSISV
jgi:trans-2,3-dihydro-3-hydroxyanthranilate isomerase